MTESAKSADSTPVTATDLSSTKTNISIEVQNFCARVMNFCDYVTGANKLSDFEGIKRVAEDVRREAMGVSKTFYKL
jgi:lipoate synthase